MDFVEILCWELHCSVLGTYEYKSRTGPNQMSKADVPTLVFCFMPKITSPEVLLGQVHCHYAKSTCMV
jgi:hypothetical protein